MDVPARPEYQLPPPSETVYTCAGRYDAPHMTEGVARQCTERYTPESEVVVKGPWPDIEIALVARHRRACNGIFAGPA